MKGLSRLIKTSRFLDRRLKEASRNLFVLATTERLVIRDREVLTSAIAKKLLGMIKDEELKKFVLLPIANEKNEILEDWTFLEAAVTSAFSVKTSGRYFQLEPAIMTVSLFNGNEGMFTRAQEIMKGLNSCWQGYATVRYNRRAGSTMCVTFHLKP